eukprot:36990_1
MDGIDVAAIVWMFFNYTVLCPIMIYYLYRFYHIRKNELVMQFRNKHIIYILNAMMLLTLLAERFYANAVAVWSVLPINGLYYLIFSVTWWSGFFLFLVKVFSLYFKQQYAICVVDMAWKTEINPDEKLNWFIMHKRTYGDPIYCAKLLAIPFVISVLINTIISIVFGESLVLDFTQLFIASMPIIASFVIFYKSRKLDDVHKIRNETLYQCIILMIALSFYLIVFLFFKLAQPSDPETGHRIEWLLRNFVADLCAIGLSLVPTAYPVILYHSTHLEYKISIELSNSDLRQAHQTETIMSITQVMSKYKSFKAFMDHLILEFSPEAMLFLVELIQVKHDYFHHVSKELSKKKNSQDNLEVDKEMLSEFQVQNKKGSKNISSVFYGLHHKSLTSVNIPTAIPKSVILGQQSSCRDRMTALYNKYIATGSHHELNLSSSRRQQLKLIFENEDDTVEVRELINCMDEAAMEILLLLQDPFRRFKERSGVVECSESRPAGSVSPVTPT